MQGHEKTESQNASRIMMNDNDDLPQESHRQISGYKWFFVCVGFYLTTFLYGVYCIW